MTTAVSAVSEKSRCSLLLGYLFTLPCLGFGIFYGATNFALIAQGYGYYIEGQWMALGQGGLGIEGIDFYASLWIQFILGGVIIGAVFAYWGGVARGWFQKYPTTVMHFLLMLGVLTLMLIATHRWFEVMICERGNLPTECGL